MEENTMLFETKKCTNPDIVKKINPLPVLP